MIPNIVRNAEPGPWSEWDFATGVQGSAVSGVERGSWLRQQSDLNGVALDASQHPAEHKVMEREHRVAQPGGPAWKDWVFGNSGLASSWASLPPTIEAESLQPWSETHETVTVVFAVPRMGVEPEAPTPDRSRPGRCGASLGR